MTRHTFLLLLGFASASATAVGPDHWAAAYDDALNNRDPGPDYAAAAKIALILRDPVRFCQVDLRRAVRACDAADAKLKYQEYDEARVLFESAESAYAAARAWSQRYAAAGVATTWDQAVADFPDLSARIARGKQRSRLLADILALERFGEEELDRIDPAERYVLGCVLVDRGQIETAQRGVFSDVPEDAAADGAVWRTTARLIEVIDGNPAVALPDILAALDTRNPRLLAWFVPLACRAGRSLPERRWSVADARLLREALDEALPAADGALRCKLVYERLVLQRMYFPYDAPPPEVDRDGVQKLLTDRAWWYAAETALSTGASAVRAANGGQASALRPIFNDALAQLGERGGELRSAWEQLDRITASSVAPRAWSAEFGPLLLEGAQRVPAPPDARVESLLDFAARIDRAAEATIGDDLLPVDRIADAWAVAQAAKLLRIGAVRRPVVGPQLDAALRVGGKPGHWPMFEIVIECYVGRTRAWAFVLTRDTTYDFSPVQVYPLLPPDKLLERVPTPETWETPHRDEEFVWLLNGRLALPALIDGMKARHGIARVLYAPDGPLLFTPLALALPESFDRVDEITYVTSSAIAGSGVEALSFDDVVAAWRLEAARSPETYAAFAVDVTARHTTTNNLTGRAVRLWGTPADDAQFFGPAFAALRDDPHYRWQGLGALLVARQRDALAQHESPAAVFRLIGVENKVIRN